MYCSTVCSTCSSSLLTESSIDYFDWDCDFVIWNGYLLWNCRTKLKDITEPIGCYAAGSMWDQQDIEQRLTGINKLM